MSTPETERIPDFDELLTDPDIEPRPEQRMRARMRLLWREAEEAILTDVSYAIQMANASSVAREKQAKISAEATRLANESPEERARARSREAMRRLRQRRRDAKAAPVGGSADIEPPAKAASAVEETREERRRRQKREAMRRVRARDRAAQAAAASGVL